MTALLARGVQAVLWLVTLGLMLQALAPTFAADLSSRFFFHLPNFMVGAAIAVAGTVLARFTERRVLIGAVQRGYPPARMLATATRAGITVLAFAVGLEHAGIGGRVVSAVTITLFGGVSLGLALAIGFGSRHFVRRWIADTLAEPGGGPDPHD